MACQHRLITLELGAPISSFLKKVLYKSFNQSINQIFVYSQEDNPPVTNASGFYRRVGGGKDE